MAQIDAEVAQPVCAKPAKARPPTLPRRTDASVPSDSNDERSMHAERMPAIRSRLLPPVESVVIVDVPEISDDDEAVVKFPVRALVFTHNS